MPKTKKQTKNQNKKPKQLENSIIENNYKINDEEHDIKDKKLVKEIDEYKENEDEDEDEDDDIFNDDEY